MPETKPTRNEQIVNLRVFATLVVVLGHCIIIFDPSWSASYGFHHQYDCHTAVWVKRFINLFQMELFFVISGVCFRYGRDKSFKPISAITKKGYRLLVPFVAIALVWMLPIRFLVGYPNYKADTIIHILYNVLTIEDAGHLWFLPVLFGIFSLNYILQKFTDNKYLLLTLSVILYLIHAHTSSILLNRILYYFLFFTIGNAVNLCALVRNRRLSVCTISFVLLMICMLLDINQSPLKVIESALIVLILFAITPSKTKPIVASFDRNSFGIYLFHSPIILIGMHTLTFYPPIYIF